MLGTLLLCTFSSTDIVDITTMQNTWHCKITNKKFSLRELWLCHILRDWYAVCPPFPQEALSISLGSHQTVRRAHGLRTGARSAIFCHPSATLTAQVSVSHSMIYSQPELLCKATLESVYKPYPKCRIKALTIPLRLYICDVTSHTLWSKVSSESDISSFLLQSNKKHLKPGFCIFVEAIAVCTNVKTMKKLSKFWDVAFFGGGTVGYALTV